jgi:hypothetical protein
MIIEVLKVYFAVSVFVFLADCIYRIVTEEGRESSWKEEAIGDIVAFIVNLLLLIGLILEW